MQTLQKIEFILQIATIPFGVLFFILGACLASFFNVVIFRLPKMIENQNALEIKAWFEEKNAIFPEQLNYLLKNINLSYPASHCYNCNTPLRWFHNIPIFSYIFLKGKCGHCNASFSIQYPIIELLGGIILLSSYLIFIQHGFLVFLLASIFFMIAFLLISIDIKTLMLPDSLTLTLLWIGLISSAFGITLINITVSDSIYGCVVGYLSLWSIANIGKVVKGEEVMGEGDFKLLAALGAFVGLKGSLFIIFFSPFIGIFTWLIFKIIKNNQIMIPYGPSLIISALFYLFYGKQFLNIIF